MKLMRREFLVTVASAALGGCASRYHLPLAAGLPDEPWMLTPREQQILAQKHPELVLVLRGPHHEVSMLRRRARPVPLDLDLTGVAEGMASTLRLAGGVGLAGPQVGLSLRIATLTLDYGGARPETIFVRNPVIIERSDACWEVREGCLSIPEVGGQVRRNCSIRVKYLDAAGKQQTRTAEGHEAVLWQHAIDHLDGVLYLDRLLGRLQPLEELRRAAQAQGAEAFDPQALML